MDSRLKRKENQMNDILKFTTISKEEIESHMPKSRKDSW